MTELIIRYTIDYYQPGTGWIWAGHGDIANGTTAILPQEVYDLADAGEEGEIEVDGIRYRVTHCDDD